MSRNAAIKTIIVTAIVLAAMAVYFFFSPEEWSFFPRCPVKMVTGYDCPSCGAQRALHAALHGDFPGALRYNLFLVVAIPFFVLALLASLMKNRLGRAISLHLLNLKAGIAYVALYCIWWVVRNIIGL